MTKSKTPTLTELTEAQFNLARQIAAAELPLVERAYKILASTDADCLKQEIEDLIAQFPADRLMAEQLGNVVSVIKNVRLVAGKEIERLDAEINPKAPEADVPDAAMAV